MGEETGTRALRPILLGLAAAAFLLLPASSVTATPSVNGKIAFVSDRDGNDEIYVMNADGSGQVDLTSAPSSEVDPAWSPDGHRLAFASDRSGVYRIYVMNADGTGLTAVAKERTSGRWPAWSPDGRTLAFSERIGDIATVEVAGSGVHVLTNVGVWFDDQSDWSGTAGKIAYTRYPNDSGQPGLGNPSLHVMNADGSSNTSVGTGSDPSWAPDGSKLAYALGADVYVMNAGGGTPTKVTSSSGTNSNPAWSTDGAKIAVASDRDSSPGGPTDIYVMDADGRNPVRLTTGAGKDFSPAWRKALQAQTITFAKLPARRVGVRDFTVTATASSGLPVAFAAGGRCTVHGVTVHLTARGSCTITASQPGDATYDAAPSVRQAFAVLPALCRVPRVVGKTLARARAALKVGHCRTGKISRTYSAARKGRVSGASRRPGRVLPPGTKVHLVVSLGPKP